MPEVVHDPVVVKFPPPLHGWVGAIGSKPPISRDAIWMCLLHGYAQELLKKMEACESPIEEAMLAGLEAQKVVREREIKGLKVNIIPQHPVKANGRRYRLDFLVRVCVREYQGEFAIECDGADFHTSEEQVAADRERTDNIEAVGISVLRFTGKEIRSNPWLSAS